MVYLLEDYLKDVNDKVKRRVTLNTSGQSDTNFSNISSKTILDNSFLVQQSSDHEPSRISIDLENAHNIMITGRPTPRYNGTFTHSSTCPPLDVLAAHPLGLTLKWKPAWLCGKDLALNTAEKLPLGFSS
ncbi:hypothetical protein RRG08_051829 [Elysia crispata]|uniref:Uncharacterized protein n=1 Tax=Elysia crispata TaxID=231223 RepID=A0AAE0Z9N2_9GAST|nr:hypothetical protein RRG08_051829 [Elysia crispata]